MTSIDASTAILRAVAGTVFLFSGLQKVVPGIESTVDRFRDLGIPWPEMLGPAVGGLELVGGVLLLAGIFTRVVAGLFVIEMAVALVADRLPVATATRSIADAVGTVRLEVLLFAVCACLALLGAGRLSVDAALRHRRAGSGSGDLA
jgi:putative oxidoreductase